MEKIKLIVILSCLIIAMFTLSAQAMVPWYEGFETVPATTDGTGDYDPYDTGENPWGMVVEPPQIPQVPGGPRSMQVWDGSSPLAPAGAAPEGNQYLEIEPFYNAVWYQPWVEDDYNADLFTEFYLYNNNVGPGNGNGLNEDGDIMWMNGQNLNLQIGYKTNLSQNSGMLNLRWYDQEVTITENWYDENGNYIRSLIVELSTAPGTIGQWDPVTYTPQQWDKWGINVHKKDPVDFPDPESTFFELFKNDVLVYKGLVNGPGVPFINNVHFGPGSQHYVGEPGCKS